MQLKQSVNHLMMEEYARAAEKFGPTNHSPHESYAVILEEVEETMNEICGMRDALADYWALVKRNTMKGRNVALKRLQAHAIHATCECIQVAAMAYKSRR